MRRHGIVSIAVVRVAALVGCPGEEDVSGFPTPEAIKHTFDSFGGESWSEGLQLRVVRGKGSLGEDGNESADERRVGVSITSIVI